MKSIALKCETPLADGKTQAVYQHPSDPRLLVKVRKLEKLQRTYQRKIGGILGYKRRHGLYTTWMRELEHYHSICLRLGYLPQFLQRYHGLVETDLGFGLVVERVADRAGRLAPTLEQVVSRSGLTRELLAEVQALSRQMNDLKISTNDISVSNIVYGWSEEAGDHLVLIEGIGVNTFIPIARWSNYFNVRSNNRHFARTIRWLERLDERRSQRLSVTS